MCRLYSWQSYISVTQGSKWDTFCASLMHSNQNSPPSRLPCAWNWPSKLASEGCVYSLKFCAMLQPKKVGMVSPLSDTHSCDLGSSAMLSAQLYTPYFQALWSSGSKINIMRSITRYSQNPNTTFKIRFWVFTHGLWRPAALKTEWFPLSWWRGSGNTP